MTRTPIVLALSMLLSGPVSIAYAESQGPAGAPHYADLATLFEQWRDFEHPILRNHVADYSERAMAAKAAALPQWRARLLAIDTRGWPIEALNDYKLVNAEMNGLDFNLRVLRPWARDPAFYVSVWPARSDVPLREGPVAYPAIELFTYRFPLSPAAQRDLSAKLEAIPALLLQARENLQASNARDLWIFGQGELRNQTKALAALQAGTLTVSTLEGSQQADLRGASKALRAAVAAASQATEEFIAWLAQRAPSKTGNSGVGKDDYTWYQQNVHFVPYTWDQEVTLLRRELERAQASLRLE